ncbi:MAG: glycosyltransferase [Candidatus Andersenbacteria bacterium]|nr:glycosyltransferase [Candidatus Andersenbacteria bacterium]
MPPGYENRPTIFKHYTNGILVDEKEVWGYKGNNKIIIHFYYYYYYLVFLSTYNIRDTSIIVSYPLFLLFYSWIAFFLNNQYIFWIFDYFPNETGFMFIYHALVNFYNRRLGIVLYLSPTLKQLHPTSTKKQSLIRKIVPFGIRDVRPRRYPQKNRIGYIGTLTEGKGLFLLLKILQENENIYLDIIGNGSLRSSLEEYTALHRLSNRVSFFGFVPDKELHSITKKWEVSVALYESKPLDYTEFTDPGKIKLYIQLGIPVIMTRVSLMHTEITANKAGVVVPYTQLGFVKGLKDVQKNYTEYMEGVERLRKANLFKDIYRAAFQFLEYHA